MSWRKKNNIKKLTTKDQLSITEYQEIRDYKIQDTTKWLKDNGHTDLSIKMYEQGIRAGMSHLWRELCERNYLKNYYFGA